MKILVDSSIVLRYAAIDDPRHDAVLEKVRTLLDEGHVLAYTPQVYRECYGVLTRPPSANGYGMGPGDAASLLVSAENVFELADDVPGVLDEL